jgi:uncharacterized membrane protein YjfL (UPF0719 family)
VLDYLTGTATNWPPAAVSLLLVLIFGSVLWMIHNAITPFDDRKIMFGIEPSTLVTPAGRVGYLIERCAFLIAFAIAAQPTVTRAEDEHPWWGLVGQAMELTWIVVAMLVMHFLVDFVVLSKVKNTEAVLAGNQAVAVVDAGFFLGFGFILNGSLNGASPTLALGIASTVVFASLGFIAQIGGWWLHEAVTPWHIRNRIAEGGLTAAFEAAGVLVALGIVIRQGVAGDFTSWTDGLVAFFWTVVFAVATLYLFRWVTNRVILRSFTLAGIQEQHRVAASAFSAVLMIVVAVEVAAVVGSQL